MNLYTAQHRTTNPRYRAGYDNIDWDLDGVDKKMIPKVWAAYNKLVEQGKIPPYRGIDTNEIVQPGAPERAERRGDSDVDSFSV